MRELTLIAEALNEVSSAAFTAENEAMLQWGKASLKAEKQFNIAGDVSPTAETAMKQAEATIGDHRAAYMLEFGILLNEARSAFSSFGELYKWAMENIFPDDDERKLFWKEYRHQLRQAMSDASKVVSR